MIDKVLWGFYSGNTPVDHATLTTIAAKHLPYYAIPTQLRYIPTLPLTNNGKVDKRLLKAMVSTHPPTNSVPLPSEIVLEKSKDDAGIITTFTALSASSSNTNLTEKQYVLPPKRGFHGGRWLRHVWFSLYRRFFSVVLLGNIVSAIVIATRAMKFHGLNVSDLATATATNLCATVLMRQDHVINMLFTVCCAVPTSFPLFIRRQCAKVYHIGGIHSGCAIASTLWFLVFTAAATQNFINSPTSSIYGAVVAVSYFIVVLLLTICVMAYPTIRRKYHNKFELVHRLAGWTALALFWAHTLVLTECLRGSQPLGLALVKSPGYWLLLIATLSVIYPWLHLRKVNVRAEVLSSHAVRLHFDYTTPIVGTAVRISERPLIEWHAFATVAKPNEKGFSLVVSNAGDWTKRQIAHSPTKLWVRGVPACGVLRITPLFRKVVLVATGSGIGPCLPVILAKRVPCRIFWSTPHPEQTFGQEIINNVLAADPNAVIHDTRTMGKPDMVAMSYKLLAESGAEAVCIISNQKLTQKVVYAMEARGIPAYGAIWDS